MTELAKPRTPLSHREHQVIGLLSLGHGYKQIASLLQISKSAVGVLVWRARKATGTRSLFELGMWAQINGYAEERLACLHEASCCEDIRCDGACQWNVTGLYMHKRPGIFR